MSNHRRVLAEVSGSVQGVGYRAFVARQAAARRLAGSATNLADGRVRVVVEGPAPDVAALVEALSGPDAPGRVEAVEQSAQEPEGLSGFTTA